MIWIKWVILDYCRDGMKGLWFLNHKSISWSHYPKNHKTFIFQELFLPKYDNFIKISADDTCLCLCLLVFKEWSWMDERTKFRKLCGYTLRSSIFFSNIFFLIPTLYWVSCGTNLLVVCSFWCRKRRNGEIIPT